MGAGHHHPSGDRGTSGRAEVVVYFADDPERWYQLAQWLPILEQLAARRELLIVTRHPDTCLAVRRTTPLRWAFAPTLADLTELYRAVEPKVVLYVNNSTRNFQSLAARSALHVHVNHGESDKVCMISNQVKAYDRVFVAGEAAVRRHRAALIEFDDRRLVRIGRPQLDLRPAPVLPPSRRRTLLYAPTWEGEEPSNNYTSLDVHGPAIIWAALAVPDARVIYKPHPRIPTSTQPRIAAAHREVARLLTSAASRDQDAGHRVESGADILAVLPGCDLMITDVSSVGLDFLYLHTDRPLFVADRHDDRRSLHAGAPISTCADVIDSGSIGALADTLAARLARDEHAAARAAIRRYYFGDLVPGQSTNRFLSAVDEVILARDRQIRDRDADQLLRGRSA
jgi:hypothetical protein